MTDDLNFKGDDPGAVRYGNFINYYQFHPPESRIESLPKDIWDIPGREKCAILDIGCNSGNLTNSIHEFVSNNSQFQSVHTLGIDIDPNLIDRAKMNSIDNVSFECIDIMSECAVLKLNKYLENLDRIKFDMIFCFSVTMWIHLNFGDNGLIKFLDIVKNYCDFIIIEPQPWHCYKTATRRMKRSASESFPLFSDLKIRQNVDEVIEQHIVQGGNFVKVHENISSKWKRKLLFFKCKSIIDL